MTISGNVEVYGTGTIDFRNTPTSAINVTFSSGASQTISGDGTVAVEFNNVTLSDNTTLTSIINLELTDFTLGSSAFLVVDGATLLTSSPTTLGTPTTSRMVDGSAGWRMLSPPVDGMTVQDLAEQNLVQGITGSYPSAEANLYIDWNGTDWAEPAGLSDELFPGRGFIWYFYTEARVEETDPLPATVDIPESGVTDNSDEEVTLNTLGEWTLVGNPYKYPMNITKLVGNGAAVPKTGQVWDPNTGSYQQVNGPVAVWQGVFIESLNGATSVYLPNAAKTSASATFYGKNEDAVASMERRRLKLALEGYHAASGTRTYDEATTLYFAEGAQDAWDAFDSSELIPLTNSYATLSFEGRRDGETVLKAQESQPLELDGIRTFPLQLTTREMGGAFTVTWPVLNNLPEGWGLVLVDQETGESVDLRQADSYTFELEGGPSAGKTSRSSLAAPRIASLKANGSQEARFMLKVGPGVATSTPDTPELPEKTALKQNYPNPFNPSTTIRYAVPERAPVSLVIYDVLGRQVATLASGMQPAGWHEATWDAADQPSGVYVYRLEVGEQTRTRKMLLVK